eukprot:TRINITY_DN33_c0_g1_i1.p1 TRINITY_DN33_c0_g1~~TRINITY_DN33_c0_g1_i1.p1  ORF type:complete len:843 (-),score=165.37 TRINITY_DN33_c0_g1_i1:1364-3892(-)
MTTDAVTVDQLKEDAQYRQEHEVKESQEYADIFDDATSAEQVKTFKREAARRFLWEGILYFIFVLIYCVSVYNGRPLASYELAESARKMYVDANWNQAGTGRIITYTNLTSVEDFYGWLQNVVIPTSFPYTSFFQPTVVNSPYRSHFLRDMNRRIGTVRLRQLRVQPRVGCRVSRIAENIISSCWPEYDPQYEETRPFGPPANTTKYVYRTADELCSPQAKDYCSAVVFGKKSAAYSANGYAIDLPVDAEAAAAVVDVLQQDHWMDFATRAVIVDLAFFNPAHRIYVAMEMIVELWPTGGLSVIHSTKPMPSLSLERPFDVFLFGLEILLISVVSLYFLQEVRELSRFLQVRAEQCVKCQHARVLATGIARPMICPSCEKRSFYPIATPQCPSCHMEMTLTSHRCWRGYLEDGWNFLDVVTQVLFAAVFAVRLKIRADIQSIDFRSVGDSFVLLYPLTWRFILADWIYSVMAVLVFTKLFKYLQKVRALASLVRTLNNAKMELVYFMVIFFALFLGFAYAFYLAFGTDVEGYSSWLTAQIFLFQIVLGAMDYGALSRSNRLLAPVYLIFYTLLVVFVLANVFIAIISASHEEAMHSLKQDRDDFLSSGLKLELNRWRMRIAKFFGREHANLQKVSRFAEALIQVPELTQQQRDNVRAFVKELEHDAFDVSGKRILAHIVRTVGEALTHPTSELSADDYANLAAAVRDYKSYVIAAQGDDIVGQPFSGGQDDDVTARVLGGTLPPDGLVVDGDDGDGAGAHADDAGGGGGAAAGERPGTAGARAQHVAFGKDISSGLALLRSAGLQDVNDLLADIELREQRVLAVLRELIDDVTEAGADTWHS